MRTYIYQYKKQLSFPDLVHQKQIAFYMTLLIVLQLTAQLVVFVFGRQLLARRKHINGFRKIRFNFGL